MKSKNAFILKRFVSAKKKKHLKNAFTKQHFMNELLEEADTLAQQEIAKYGLPSKKNYDTANKKGLQLAKQLGANTQVIQLATRLMDVKLGEAKHNNRIQDHVHLSVQAAEKFLNQQQANPKLIQQVLACVHEHHQTSWSSKEAEICANADCYRFLDLNNWLSFIHEQGRKQQPYTETLALAIQKFEEKRAILSLQICKEELKEHQRIIQELIDKMKTL